MNEPVDNRCRDDVIGKDFAPTPERHVARDQDRALLIARRINWKNKFVVSVSNGRYPTSSMISSR